MFASSASAYNGSRAMELQASFPNFHAFDSSYSEALPVLHYLSGLVMASSLQR